MKEVNWKEFRKTMKIMTFNTQHCLAYLEQKIDFKIMADVINKYNPDIVGLNEMRNKGDNPAYTNQVKTLSDLTELKYHYFAKAIDDNGNNPYGNGFLSRYPIEEASVIRIPVPDDAESIYYEDRVLLKVKLHDDITVIVTHFGLTEKEQKNAVKTVIENIEDKRCILMGDFNITPDNGILKPIKEKMKDTADFFEKPLLSWPSDEPQRKIDYIFVSEDIEIVWADIPAVVASDHRPHIAQINF